MITESSVELSRNVESAPQRPLLPSSPSLAEIVGFNRRALFLGGCPKSGTTLLLALLDGHPALATLPAETHYLEELAKHAGRRSPQANLRALLSHLAPDKPNGERFERVHGQKPADASAQTAFDFDRFSRLAAEFAAKPWVNDSLLLSETIRAHATVARADWRGCVRWVEKTPSNIAHTDDLFRLYPEAKLIHIVRDPRAIFASRRRRLLNRYGTHKKAHRLVREWNQSVRQITRLGARRGQYLLLRYEDLAQNSRAVLHQVCRFVGIEFLPVLLQPTLGGKPWSGNSTFFDALPGINAAPVNQWKTELSDEEIWWVEYHCREGMNLTGYPLLTGGRFSWRRWARPLPHESWSGYLRARKSSLCQWGGLLEDCRYEPLPHPTTGGQPLLSSTAQ